jgi:hypothetical protein
MARLQVSRSTLRKQARPEFHKPPGRKTTCAVRRFLSEKYPSGRDVVGDHGTLHQKCGSPEWHEVRQNACVLACKDTGVWIHQASPVCLGGHVPITEEVIRGFRTSPPSCHASPASGPRGGNPTRCSPPGARSATPGGVSACSRPSPLCTSSSCRCGMATRLAAIDPIGRADGARRRPTVKPGPDSRAASWPTSWSASAGRCRHRPGTTGGGLGLAPASARARAARGLSPPA